MKTVGIDKDNISLLDVKELKNKIENEQKCNVILYQTKRGFHLLLIFDKEISIKNNFKIREKYGDCSERLSLSKMRNKMGGVPTDILFSIKKYGNNTYRRRRVW
jgi:hypothetical protein